jgi:hypothetical protein
MYVCRWSRAEHHGQEFPCNIGRNEAGLNACFEILELMQDQLLVVLMLFLKQMWKLTDALGMSKQTSTRVMRLMIGETTGDLRGMESYAAHLDKLLGMSLLNMSSCFMWTAIFASSISGRSCRVLSVRCSEPLYTMV